MAQPPLLAPLADWVAAYDGGALDSETRERLFASVFDYGCALWSGTGHGLYDPYLAALAGVPGESGPCSVAGDARGFPLAHAAAMNAAIAHFWEVDDADRVSTSHPGITVISAVLALAQAFPQIPRDRLAGAVVTGYEAIMRIGSYLGSGHYATCHTTGTAGTFGAAAAASHALGLDGAATLSAFGHAGTQAAGLWQILDDGATDAKAFHGANAVRNGLAATLLARAGIAGAAHILEGPRGMLKAWNLPAGDPVRLIPGARAMIHDVTIKGWPVCGQMHSALDCAVDLVAAYAPDPDEIASVRLLVPQACLNIAAIDNPQTVSKAKFSTSFCIAAVLAGSPPDFVGLGPELVADDRVRNLAQRVAVIADAAFDARFPRERPARLEVTLRDGQVLTEERSFRRGDPEAPWSEQDLLVRAQDILRLSAMAVDVQALHGWAKAFAGLQGSPGWRAGHIFALGADMGAIREIAG